MTDAYVQEILLHHRMEDDGDKEVEDDGGAVLPAVVVKRHLSFCTHTEGGGQTNRADAYRQEA